MWNRSGTHELILRVTASSSNKVVEDSVWDYQGDKTVCGVGEGKSDGDHTTRTELVSEKCGNCWAFAVISEGDMRRKLDLFKISILACIFFQSKYDKLLHKISLLKS